MILPSWHDHYPISVHPQLVCNGYQRSSQLDLTIPHSLSILRKYVMVLNDPVNLTWPFPNLCPYSGSMWWLSTDSCQVDLTISNLGPSSASMLLFSMILTSWHAHFPISVHSQVVCDGSPESCEVKVTILHSLPILSMYVMLLHESVKLTWPFSYPQHVCDTSQWFCQVDLMISQSLSLLSLYVVVLNDPVGLTWPFPNLCPPSGCMWWFSMILLTWPDHFLISVHPQEVCDGC